MRMDKRYSRVREMITAPAVPKLRGGGVALCHSCQRTVYFAGGFIELLAKSLDRQARMPSSKHWSIIKRYQKAEKKAPA